MSYGGGIFQIKPSPSAFETTSWNTSIAYYIEITNWDKGPSSGTSCNSMQALIGAASGRLYISFQGSEHGLENSWISGVFKDAPIVYCGSCLRCWSAAAASFRVRYRAVSSLTTREGLVEYPIPEKIDEILNTVEPQDTSRK